MQHFITQYGYLAVFVLMLASRRACRFVGGHHAVRRCARRWRGGRGAPVARRHHHRRCPRQRRWQLRRVGGQAGTPARRPCAAGDALSASASARSTGLPPGSSGTAPPRCWSGRVIPVVRTFISLPAGFAAVPPVRFGVYTTLGCIPWTAAWALRATHSAPTGRASPMASTADLCHRGDPRGAAAVAVSCAGARRGATARHRKPRRGKARKRRGKGGNGAAGGAGQRLSRAAGRGKRRLAIERERG